MSTGVTAKTYTVALAGQPNTGKSTVFNRLTGARQHVGNWPGKTVEKKTGIFFHGGVPYTIVDLPGTYSLTANSLEEKIARDFLIHENPDVVVVLADASQLERTLYLLAEVTLLEIPVVLALNMMDVAEDQGKRLDIESFQASLGIPVVPMAAAKGEGLDSLLTTVAGAPDLDLSRPEMFLDDPGLREKCETIESLLSGYLPSPYSKLWMAVKLIEGDTEAEGIAEEHLPADIWKRIEAILDRNPDGALLMAGARYSWIKKVLAGSVHASAADSAPSRESGFDRAATHPVWGKFMAVGIMILAFGAAMIVALPVMMGAQIALPALSAGVRDSFSAAPPWVGSFFADGLIPGLGVALMMLAYIFGVYLVFGILEDVGYLARLAFVFDRTMNRLGLHGKSFMPLLMSFGCNIAGVTGTRVVDSWRQRMITLVMVSIVPCLALWTVVSFIGTIFFGAGMPLVVTALLVAMFLHLNLTSALLRKAVLKGEKTGLIMELPPYHKPNWNTIWGYVWIQVRGFMKRAVTLIALVSVIVWALSFQRDGNMENSILASIGRFFHPVSGLMGLDWKLFIALIAAVVAKEASLSVLAVLYGIGRGALSITSLILPGSGGFEDGALVGALSETVSPASALAFIFAFFFSIPCIGTVATIYSETRSLKWTIGCSLYYTLMSFVAGVLAYNAGLLIF